jgi:peptidoglycan/LPS O-acetylase OafA/YrhL
VPQSPKNSAEAAPLNFKARFPALDSVRGIAILAVFTYSYGGGAVATVSHGPLRFLAELAAFGWSGVDLFFALSGFLITGILYDTQNEVGYYRKFYIRRVLRIFPIYYLLFAVYFALTPLLHCHWSLGHFSFLVYLGFPAALLWPSLIDVSPYVVLPHLWSVSVEEQFYMLWPFGVSRLRKPQRILVFCACAMFAALLLRILFVTLGPSGESWSYTFLFCRMDGIALGSALAILFRTGHAQQISQIAPWVFVGGICALLALAIVRHTTSETDPFFRTIGFSLIVITSGALLSLALNSRGWIAAICSTPVLRLFGKYSYAIYLFHRPLTVLLSPHREAFVRVFHSYALGSLIFLIAALAVNLLLAAISYRFFEGPILRLKSRFSYA